MIDNAVSNAIQKASEQALEQTGKDTAAKGAEANAQDVTKFEQAMQPRTDAQPPPTAVGPTTQVEAIVAPTAPTHTTLGENILDGIGRMGENYQAQVDKVQTQLENTADTTMSVQDAVKLQFDLMQLNLQQDLASKVSDKTSQGVQTLFKNQG